MTACCGGNSSNGSSSKASYLEAACLATAIGAVVCEYDHLPPWNYEVLERIRFLAKDMQLNVTKISDIL